ncbi:hypothetical protein GGI35DRAFT_491960 [Trichoderma velutinum]
MTSTLPDQLVSLATIRYLGYDDDTASQIWNKWTAQAPGDDPVPECIPLPPFELRFIDYVIAYSYCMDRCGINEDTQAAIMDPVFRRIRLTESCIFWVRNTIELRYEALESSVQEASREREHASQRTTLHLGGSTSRGTSREGTGDCSGFESLQMTTWVSRDTALSEAALRVADAPGSLTLYRSVEKARLKRLFDSNGNLDNIRMLSSRPPTDFDGKVSAYCFAVDRDVAIQYAAFSKRRSDRSSVVIVHATFESSTIESLSEEKIQRIYWPSEEWKRLVFFSRNGKKLPSDLGKFKQASLIIGTAAARPSLAYANMKCYTEITGDMVLKNAAGHEAVQYVFLDDEGEELLEKAELKVFPITTTEIDQWYREERLKTSLGDFGEIGLETL